jgi:hypothetical protein
MGSMAVPILLCALLLFGGALLVEWLWAVR